MKFFPGSEAGTDKHFFFEARGGTGMFVLFFACLFV